MEYQEEFANLLSQGTETPEQPAQEAPTAEEMLDLSLGGKAYKIPVSTEVPFKHNGTIQKVPFSKLLNQYRQSDHLESKMGEYKRMKEEIEKERGDLNSYNMQRQKYDAIQKWSEENPQAWDSLYALWQNREQALQQGGEQAALLAEVGQLRNKLNEAFEKIGSFEQERESSQTEKAVVMVKGQIEGFKKEFPEIDLDEKDQEGLTVKDRIIAFGVQNNLDDFDTAALKYLKPRLMETILARGRNEAVKGVVRDKKEGIVSRGRTPASPGQSAKEIDPRKMSYEDLNAAAKAEYESLVNTST